jgi:hypothetical protein
MASSSVLRLRFLELESFSVAIAPADESPSLILFAPADPATDALSAAVLCFSGDWINVSASESPSASGSAGASIMVLSAPAEAAARFEVMTDAFNAVEYASGGFLSVAWLVACSIGAC